jgi:hypothetical protein
MGLCSLFVAGFVMAIEEPNYAIIEKLDNFELRSYEPRIVAQTLVSGSMDQASNDGFRRIADYIFGNNRANDGTQQKVSMTVPVTLQPRSENISMTTAASLGQSDGQWRVEFLMPSQFTLETLPTPNNSVVNLREIPAGHYAAIRFSGLADEVVIANRTAELMNWLDNRNITPAGQPILARYNSPWTLPFLRRNEVMVAY